MSLEFRTGNEVEMIRDLGSKVSEVSLEMERSLWVMMNLLSWFKEMLFVVSCW